MSRKSGAVRLKLITGRTVYVHHPGPLPSILILESGPTEDGEPGSRVPCLRVDVDRYRQMRLEEMIEAGLVGQGSADGKAEAEAGPPEHDAPPADR